MGTEWDVKLFDCCQKPLLCCCAFFIPIVPCCLQISAYHRVTDGGKCVPCLLACCLPIIGAAINREGIRVKLNFDGNCIGSCCTWCFCPCCASLQEYNQAWKT